MTLEQARCFLNNIAEFNARCQKNFEESSVAKSEDFREIYEGLASIFESNKKDVMLVLILLESKKKNPKIKLTQISKKSIR